MRITTALFYRPDHRNNLVELRYCDSIEQAEKMAQLMIEQFQFWGGGEIPVSVTQTRWTKKGATTLYNRDYDPAECMPYARENGDKCEYLRIRKLQNTAC